MIGAGSNQDRKDCCSCGGSSGEGEGSQSTCATLFVLDAPAKPATRGAEKFAVCPLAVENLVVKGLSGSSVGADVAAYVDERFSG
jgi:hypothetical protein